MMPQGEQMSELDRPDWNNFFMTLAFIVAQKSIDPETKHGCIVVGEDRSILSVGYNSPPRGCIDENIPLTRPEKYPFFAHSEENSISNAAANGVCLKNSTFFITGHPCSRCFRGIINVGAKKIIYGPVNASCVTDEEKEAIHTMNYLGKKHIENWVVSDWNVEMVEYDGDVTDVLSRTINYLDKKM